MTEKLQPGAPGFVAEIAGFGLPNGTYQMQAQQCAENAMRPPLGDIAVLLMLYVGVELPGDNEFAHHRLHQMGLLHGATTVTDKGRAYCEALREVPLPVQRWVMP